MEFGRAINEQQRPRLAVLSAQSQMTTIARLERQEKTTSNELAQITQVIRSTDQPISERRDKLQRGGTTMG